MPNLHLHFDHLQLFNYTGEDLQRSVNAAITRILPGVERLCDNFNLEKLSDSELQEFRFRAVEQPEKAMREGRSKIVAEKGLPLIIIAVGVAVAFIVMAYKVGSAIDSFLNSEEKNFNEDLQAQNDLLKAQNEAMKHLIERLKRDVIVLADRLDHIEQATR